MKIVQFFKDIYTDFVDVVENSETQKRTTTQNKHLAISLTLRVLALPLIAGGCGYLGRAFMAKEGGKAVLNLCGAVFSFIVAHDSLQMGLSVRKFALSSQIGQVAAGIWNHFKSDTSLVHENTILFKKVSLLFT